MFVLVITFSVAPFENRMVLLPAVAETVVLAMVRELPSLFKPSMVTWSLPMKSIRGKLADISAEIVRGAPPVGRMRIEV